MRKYHFSASDRKLNLDWIDDEWLWLFAPEKTVQEAIEWTDQEILHICDCLLEDSLRNLFDGRCSPETVYEIYRWIMNTNDSNPFSFNNCCKLSGLDPDELRKTVCNRLYQAKRRDFH